MSHPGLLLQLDGSTHRWFGNKKTCLMAIIDDATSELHAEFFPSETTSACMKLLRSVLEQKGAFKALYVDRAGLYGGSKRCHFSQVQRACEEVNIEIIYAHSPEAKGRIERAFGTLQDRLIPELGLQGIKDLEGANKYLQTTFIPKYWDQQIVVQPDSAESEYTKLKDEVDLNEIFIQKEYRKIRNDHTFSFGNTFYTIESDLRFSIVKQEIEIRIYPDNSLRAFFGNEELIIKEAVPTKKANYEPEIQKKVDAIELAKKLGNISEASRITGISRQSLHKNKKELETKGPMALKRTYNSNHRHKNRASQEIEKIVINFSLDNPHLGQSQVARHLKESFKIDISSGDVRNICLRYQMQTIQLRVKKGKQTKLDKAS